MRRLGAIKTAELRKCLECGGKGWVGDGWCPRCDGRSLMWPEEDQPEGVA